MSDGRKRLSGWEYKKRAATKEKLVQEENRKIPKIDTFFQKRYLNVNVNEEEVVLQMSMPVPGTTADEVLQHLHTEEEESQKAEDDVNVPVPLVPGLDCAVGPTSCNGQMVVQKGSDTQKDQGGSPFSSDPALWVINEEMRDYIALNGFQQNKSSYFPKSARKYPDRVRHLTSSIFQRKLKNQEVAERHWLVYSESQGSVYCVPCLAFGGNNKESNALKTGFSDWKHAEERVSCHEATEEHKTALVALITRADLKGRVDNKLMNQVNEEKSYWKEVLKRVVAAVKALSSRGLAFRGKNETFGDVHNGNYLMTLELIAEFDPFLASHIERHGNKGSGHANYLSSTICDEFIALMAAKVLKTIGNELKTSKYFSIIVDSTPDIAHVDQLTIVVRYVLPTGEPCERFLKFLPSVGHKAEQMYLAITSQLKHLQIDIADCRGQSYDNASNMSGVYNGLQAKIKEDAPLADYVPCAAHSINLVASSAAESCFEACAFFIVLQELYVFFSCSTYRWEKLKSQMETENGRTLKRVNITRWSAREDACRSLRESWCQVLSTLNAIENDTTEKPIARSEAKGLLRKLQRLETAIMVVVWSTLLGRMNKVSQVIQSATVDLIIVGEAYQSLVTYASELRNDFKNFENKAQELSGNEYESIGKRQVRRKKFADEENDDDEPKLNASDSFRISTYNIIFDRVIVELKKRQKAYSAFSDKFDFIPQVANLPCQLIREKARSLTESYPNDLEEDFIEECVHLKGNLPPSVCSLQNVSTFLSTNRKNIYPNVNIAIRIALSIPATNCTGERSFSCLKRVKNYYRSTLGQEKLNALAILSMEATLTKELEFDDVINQFSALKARKKNFL